MTNPNKRERDGVVEAAREWNKASNDKEATDPWGFFNRLRRCEDDLEVAVTRLEKKEEANGSVDL